MCVCVGGVERMARHNQALRSSAITAITCEREGERRAHIIGEKPLALRAKQEPPCAIKRRRDSEFADFAAAWRGVIPSLLP